MAGVAVFPASLLVLITDITNIPANTGVFKKDCADLARRVCLLTHLVEEIKDSSPPPESNTPLTPIPSDCDWWSDLVVGLQASKRLLSTATSFQARDSSEGAAKRISFQFQCVTWKLEKALGNLPYDQYSISDEVREQVELARSQLRRAMQRYGSLNSKKFSNALSEPTEKVAAALSNTKSIEKMKSIQETEDPNVTLCDEKKKKSESPRRKSSSVSLAFFLSKDADDERLEKAINKRNDDDDSKKSEQLTIPEDFLCPISLELMKDPVIVSTGQTYERSYIRRWIDCGNLRCPKTQQKLENFTLTPNYVLRSLISQWCTKHNIEQLGSSTNRKTENRDPTLDMSTIRSLVRKLSTRSIEDRRRALSEIRSLSKRNTENRILIAEAGAIPVLVNLLTSDDAETQEKAVTCVLNLSLYDSNKELIMLAGAPTSIVQVLRVGTMAARENAAATIFSLSLADENKMIIGGSAAIPALVELLDNGSVRGKKDAATALFNLCICHANRGRAVRAGIINPLVKMLSESDGSSHRMVDEALAILSVLASDEAAKAAISKACGIPSLVRILQKDQARNRENAAAVLLSICKRDNAKLISIGRLGAVVPLMELSRNGTERAKQKANSLLELLRNASQ